MLKKYSVTQSKESKLAPSQSVINSILNFSKSLEVKEVKKKKIVIHLN